MNIHIRQWQQQGKKRAKPGVKTLFLLSKFELWLAINFI
jgi:hypothetical protein